MGPLWLHFRAEARRRRASFVALVVLVGLGGGLAMGAAMAARRSASAMPRLLAESNASDVLVNPDFGGFSALRHEVIAALPQVAEAGYVAGLPLVPATPDGEPDEFFFEKGIALGADGSYGYTIDRVVLRQGGLPDPARPEEVLVNPALADRLELEVGDPISLVYITSAGWDALQVAEESGEDVMPEFTPLTATVSGIGYSPTDVSVEESFDAESLIFGPGFVSHYDSAVPYWGGSYRLTSPTLLREFQDAVEAMAPDESVAFKSSARKLAEFQRAVRPEAVALGAFAAVLALAVLVVAAQAMARLQSSLVDDRAVVQAMGVGRAHTSALGALHGATVGATAAAVAVAVAAMTSRWTPTGVARAAEPHPGLRLDASVMGVGAVVVLTGVVVSALVTARHAAASGRLPHRASALSAWLTRSGAPLPVTMGARLALERGTGRASAPVRSSIAGVALGLAMVVGAATFYGSLVHLTSTPRLYGTTWDTVLLFSPDVSVSDKEDVVGSVPQVEADATASAAELLARPEVDGVSLMLFGQVAVGGRTTPTFGIDPVGDRYVGPLVVSGRVPSAADEIALGARTLRRIGAKVGDPIELAGRSLTVTGEAVFPGFAAYPGQDKAELGDGALLSLDGLRAVTTPVAGISLLIDAADDVDARALFEDYDAPSLSSDGGILFDRFRPAEIVTLSRVRATPLVLAATLALLGFASLAHALITSIRRRHQVLAVLRTLGCSSRQVRGTVMSQATLMAGASAVIGLPLGLALGRWAWTFTIDRLGGAVVVVTPWAALGVLAAAVLVLSLLVAAWPARTAVRLAPAALLRWE